MKNGRGKSTDQARQKSYRSVSCTKTSNGQSSWSQATATAH